MTQVAYGVKRWFEQGDGVEGHPVLTLRLSICPLSKDSAFPALLLPAITARASSPQKMNKSRFLEIATPVAGTALSAASTGKTHGLTVLRYPP